MTDRLFRVKPETIEWLLENENPSVRYDTLTGYFKKPADDPEVVEARAAIMKTGVVPKILSKQKPGGYWVHPLNYYDPTKYKGTVWQLIVLAAVGADGRDERLAQAANYILEYAQDRQSGGFAYKPGLAGGGDHENVIPCLTGNMVWSLLRLGYGNDERVQQGVDWIVKYLRFDDKEKTTPKGWPYDVRTQCWGKHTCMMGIVKCLKALEEIPSAERSREVNAVINSAAEFLLRHHVFKRSHNLSKNAKESWLLFGFPLMYNTDVLEMMGLLTSLGYREIRMDEAVGLILSKQDPEGRWMMETSFNRRMQVNIEQEGKPSKWITLSAIRTLTSLGDKDRI